METISKVLFWVANSLLIPDVIILLILFVRALLLTGSFYNQFVTKFKNDKALDNAIKNLSAENIDELRNLLPKKDNSLYIRYLRDLLSHPPSDAYADFMISNFENHLHVVSHSRDVARRKSCEGRAHRDKRPDKTQYWPYFCE